MVITGIWHINREYEGIEISFDGKPSEEIRNKMKAVGFKWSSAQMKWYAKDNDRTRKVANELATQGEEVGERLSFEQKMEREKERAERRQERLGARAKPAPKPLETFVTPSPTDYISRLCKQSPLNHGNILKMVDAVDIHDIGTAIQIIKDCKTLDEFDKYELEELLKHKEAGITPMKMPALKKIAPKPKMKIIPVSEVIGEREREREREKEEEAVPHFKAVQLEYQHISPQNARRFFGDYKKYLSAIFDYGLQAWFEAHREAYKFSLTSSNLDSLATALERAIVLPAPVSIEYLADLRVHGAADPALYKLADKLERMNRIPSIRERVGAEFIQRTARQIIQGGLLYASEQYNWRVKYDSLNRKDMPDSDTFKKDILGLVRSGTLLSFD